ncbi:xanthine dehydrogenase family protein molybdopterin-binding subunit [Rhodoplanes azumiensis]|uniref:Xanthine dehydrogenase family protein molybdopterin-binding subunit n=1 Tax=Rhodoplanes azumiensis TaxID=1897628 RepID=A0ABW5AGC7_9BRAD
MKHRGRGIASMWYPVGFTGYSNPSGAVVKLNEDGSAVVLTGTVETGQGSLGALSQIAAEALGIAPNDIHIVSGDTDTCPMDTGAIASRTTYITGNAVRLAAEMARDTLFQVASGMLGVKPDQLEAKDRKIQVKGFPSRAAALADVCTRAYNGVGTPPIGSATWDPPMVPMDAEGQGKPFGTYVYATQIAEVDVDDETGEVEVLRITASHDCGTAVNPMLVEGQIDGGVYMGLGFGLYEEILFDKTGRQVNCNLTNYILPTSLDMPEIDEDIVENFDETGPFGAKAVGEPSLVPTAAAVTNAIYDAVGVRITSLPATSEKVLKAIKAKRAAEQKQIPA